MPKWILSVGELLRSHPPRETVNLDKIYRVIQIEDKYFTHGMWRLLEFEEYVEEKGIDVLHE